MEAVIQMIIAASNNVSVLIPNQTNGLSPEMTIVLVIGFIAIGVSIASSIK